MAISVCPNGEDRKGKHKWAFVRNTSTGKMSFGPSGTRGVFSVRGVYVCDCGTRRIGQSKSDAPGSDLRDYSI